MGTLKFKYGRTEDAGADCYISVSDYNRFNASLLDLGDISADGKYFEALAAIFDLEAFTSFANQIDPHLVIPEFLDEFLKWLFEVTSNIFLMRIEGDKAVLWGQLPFFAKFMGDGVLFLWDTRESDPVNIGNIVLALRLICNDYQMGFLPNIRKRVSKSPAKLRCGIARGQIISIGNGKDFVGPCINVASRLQKIGQFSFAFSKRGFNLEKCFAKPEHDNFILIRASIRGIGDEELVYVYKDEFDLLSEDEKNQLLA